MSDPGPNRAATIGRGGLLLVALALIGGCTAAVEPPRASVGLTTATPGAVATMLAAPTASPPPKPSPSTTAASGLLGPTDKDRPLKAGTYRVADPFGVPFAISFPTEWTAKTMASADVQFLNTAVNGGDSAAWVVIDLVDDVFADPCHTDGGPIKPPVASTVDGVVAALTHMVGYKAGPVSDVVIGGHAGKAVELTNSIDTDTAGCTGGSMLAMWTFQGGASGTNGGAHEQIWVIDVGGTLVLVDGETFLSTPVASRSEIEQVVKTIAFE